MRGTIHVYVPVTIQCLCSTFVFFKYGTLCLWFALSQTILNEHRCANVLAKFCIILKNDAIKLDLCVFIDTSIRLFVSIQNESARTHHMREIHATKHRRKKKTESFTNLWARTVREVNAKTTFKSSFIKWLNYPLHFVLVFILVKNSNETNGKWNALK